MVYMGTYECKDSETGKITPEELFTNAYAKEVNNLEQARTFNKWLHAVLYAK